MKIFCDNCGNEITHGAQFCDNCGDSNINHKTNYKTIFNKRINRFFSSFSHLNKPNIYKIAIGVIICILLLVFFNWQYTTVKEADFNANNSAEKATQAQDELNQFKQQTLQDIADEKSQEQQVIDQNQNQKPTISEIISKWQPIIAYVECEYTDSSGGTQDQSGSGTLLISKDGSRSILTNFHVVSDGNGNFVTKCGIKLPDDATVYTAYNSNNDITTTQDTADVAYVNIENPDTYLENMTTSGRSYCSDVPNIGDEIVVLGYPDVGSPTGITATDGIISGYNGNYYVTSAKVEHGNSGGAAIDVSNNCYLGIPTYVSTDSADSLADILKWQAF
jgi:S1-C subfamily serine protease